MSTERSRTEAARRRQALSAEARAELTARLRGAAHPRPAAAGHEAPRAEPIPRHDGPDSPLSPTQERFWLHQRLFPGDASVNVFIAVRLRGPLDTAALRHSCAELLRRHEVLRSVFAEVDGVPRQLRTHPAPLELPRADLTAEPRPEAALERLAEEEAGRPFDLAAEPPCRVKLAALGADHHVLLLTLHHIATDGWSNTVLLEELAAGYTLARENPGRRLPAPELQFADYARWRGREPRTGAGGHWDAVLSGASPVLDLPLDRPRSAGTPIRSGRLVAVVPPETTQEFTRLCGSLRVPLFAGLTAALQVLLYRYTGESGFLVGVPFSGRSRAELTRVVGPLFTTIPIRADLTAGMSFRELALRVRTSVSGAFANADSFSGRLPGGPAAREGERSAPYDVLFALQDAPPPRVTAAGLTVERIELGQGTAQCPLTLSVAPEGGGLRVTVDYDRAILDPETAGQLARHHGELLRTLAAAPDLPVGAVGLLDEAERERVLDGWNRTTAPVTTPATVHEAFLRQVRLTPDAPALTCGRVRLTYAGLAERVRAEAGRLAGLGVRRGDVVGVCAERSPELVVALLAVLTAGAAYLPLDPSHPAERNRRALLDAGSRHLLVDPHPRCRPGVPGGRVLDLTAADAGPDRAEAAGSPVPDPPGTTGADVAYVMYTSGSTGTPKGVTVPHEGICNDLEWRRRVTGLGPGDVLLHTVSFSFDPSVWQLFGPLAAGAEVVLATAEEAADPESVAALVREHRVTVADFVPSTLARLLEAAEPGDLDSLTHVFCGGERLPGDLAARFHRRLRARLFNQYGPTEATVDTTSAEVVPVSAESPRETGIGRPIANKRVYVLGPDLEPVPVRVPGELWIGGMGLAYGYVGSPAATADRFRPDPYGPPGARMYRSGDRARHRHDGSLEFLGRLDDQVKLNGVRIEPAEVAQALRGHPAVDEAVVLLRRVRGRPALVGYVVTTGFDEASLRAHLRERVPPAFVPAHLLPVERIPLGHTGKVDAARLPDPPEPAAPEPGHAAARGTAERVLADLWARALGVDEVAGDADFFQAGGDSLLAMRLVATVRRRFGVELAMHEFFAAPTIGELAGLIRSRRAGTGGVRRTPPLRRRTGDRVPLSHAQERVHDLAEAGAGAQELEVSLAVRLVGDLDPEVLGRALNTVVARHEALRVRVVPARAPGLPPEQIVRRPYEVRVGQGSVPALRPEAGELMTAGLARPGPGEHELTLALHRIAVDGASTRILAHELAVAYAALRAGKAPDLPRLGLQHPDHAAWERSWLTGEVVDEAAAAWLRTAPDLPRPGPHSAGLRRLPQRVTLDAETTRALTALARELRCGLRTILLTAWTIACDRLLAPRPVVCVPVSGRDQPVFQQVIGRFVNLAALVVSFDGAFGLAERIRRVREAEVDAYRRQRLLPFAALERAAGLRGSGRVPAFPMMFDFADRPAAPPRIGGLDIVIRPPDEYRADFGLALHAHHHTDDTLELTMLHDPEIYGAEPMADLFTGLRTVLGDAIAHVRRGDGR
ncbi:non-ribosomal peptide synthetase [Rhizohabitans arisaemae]|uniref:non-ribosomal peptide synthetase n=1 Tax=Rhizohabitans arisaemae TaxID=2720610 RepID=UPI0024B07131|nr:non-ribosomal peptide synthetase [Rhizohabitans arisaemae]